MEEKHRGVKVAKKAYQYGSRSQPGSLTALGWVLHGLADSRAKPVDFINHIHIDPTDLAAPNESDDLVTNAPYESSMIHRVDYLTVGLK